MERTPVLAICGSLRQDSLHRGLLTAVAERAPRLQFVGTDLVRDLPLFDPDLDLPERLPAAAREFRLLAEASQAAVIASPEYLYAPSGITKNALDWLAGSTGLLGKPVLLLSASPGETGGMRGIAGLMPTLVALDARTRRSGDGLARDRSHPSGRPSARRGTRPASRDRRRAASRADGAPHHHHHDRVIFPRLGDRPGPGGPLVLGWRSASVGDEWENPK